MNASTIWSIVLAVLFAIASGASFYLKTSGSISDMARQLITYIEGSGLSGSEKMSYVVQNLYNHIPAPLKMIFTAERIQRLAQEVFDVMKSYALKYIERIEKENSEKAKTE